MGMSQFPVLPKHRALSSHPPPTTCPAMATGGNARGEIRAAGADAEPVPASAGRHDATLCQPAVVSSAEGSVSAIAVDTATLETKDAGKYRRDSVGIGRTRAGALHPGGLTLDRPHHPGVLGSLG